MVVDLKLYSRLTEWDADGTCKVTPVLSTHKALGEDLDIDPESYGGFSPLNVNTITKSPGFNFAHVAHAELNVMGMTLIIVK